jgi:TRAP-type C4-dicarboxylate transport system permease small subunit
LATALRLSPREIRATDNSFVNLCFAFFLILGLFIFSYSHFSNSGITVKTKTFTS